MFKIIKWGLIGTVAAGATGYFLFGSDVVNYVTTMASEVKDGVRGEIPVDFELKRAEHLIREIGPQVHQCKVDVARQDIRLENLVDEVENLERKVAREESKLKVGAATLSSTQGQAYYELASGTYSRERVEIDLERTFEAYKQNKALLKSKKALIERQNHAVAAAKQKLDAVQAKQAQLTDLVGQLKTQKAQVDAMRASAKTFDLDDSALGKAQKVLADVKERLDVAQRMLEDDEFFGKGIADVRPHRNIVKEIREHFAKGDKTGEGLVEVGTRRPARTN